MITKQELFKSISNLQLECNIIQKTTTGYNYKYMDLTTLIRTIKPLLHKYDLGYTSYIKKGHLITRLFHVKSNEWIESKIEINIKEPLKGLNIFQTFGAAITYYRRYSLESLLGLTSTEDQNIENYSPIKDKDQSKPKKQNIADEKQLSWIQEK